MTPTESRRNPVEELADEFLARYRRGERPALTEFTSKHADLADEIRDLFPALVMMEEAGRRDTEPPASDNKVPDRVGDYHILREVGRGGMGIVYEAEHEALGRHVALKVLPTHAMLDSRHLARFHREARAAARLHHTNIVPVFGVGQQDGLHFYVMQFIQGLGLDEVLMELSRQRRPKCPTIEPARSGGADGDNEDDGRNGMNGADGAIGEEPRRRLSVAGLSAVHVAQGLMTGVFERAADESSGDFTHAELTPLPAAEPVSSRVSVSDSVASGVHLPGQDAHTTISGIGHAYWQSVARIGVQVADALEYANGQGVLHRDIKPSNLLLDTHGTVWVTDFGLAKSSDSDDVTGTGDIVGTLRYLAPERLHGRSDVLGDTYSLGVTLYELLTLRPAFVESDRLKLIRSLEHDDPPRPHTIDATIPRDLETVVLKAIAKDPADRYQSASELATDLRQFLEDKPIHARRVGVRERVWRWCRRNRAVAGLLASVAVLLATLGVGGAVANLLRIERNRAVTGEQRATDAEGETRRLLTRAEAAETENKIRSHLAQATAVRRSGQAGQRFGCLEEIAQAMQLSPPDALRRQLRNEAIAALSMTDVAIRWQRPIFHSVGHSCDPQFARYAATDTTSWDTLVRRMADDHEELRVPKPEGRPWHTATEFSADGQFLAVVHFLRGAEPLLEVWSIEGRERVHQQRIRSAQVMAAVAFHPNGRWLLYCLPDGELCVWDFTVSREVKRVPLGLTPYSLCVDSRGERVAANDNYTGTVKIVDLESGRELAAWHDQTGGWAMAWSADDQLLAVAGLTRIFVWNVPRGELVSVLEGHSGSVIWAQFAHRGHTLATWSWDGTTRLWDAVTGESLVQVPGALLRFSSDDRQLGFIDNGNIGVWDMAGGLERRTLHPNTVGNRTGDRSRAWLTRAEFLRNGRLLATSSSEGVHLWDGDTIEALGHLDTGSTLRVLLHPSEDYLITSGVAGVLRWPIRRDATTNLEEWRIGPPQLLYEHSPGSDNDVAWFPDHRAVAVNASERSEVVILAVENSDPPSPPIRLRYRFGTDVRGIDVSSDGKWIAGGGFKLPGIQVWNVATGEIECVLPPRFEETRDDTIFGVRFSPDNRWLVCQAANGSGGGVGYYFWEVGSWKKAHFVGAERTSAVAVAFTPDGRRLAAAASQDEIMLADPADGRELIRFSTLPVLRSWPAGFHPGGGKLITAAYPDTVHVWDLDLIRQHMATLGLDWEESSTVRESDRTDTAKPKHKPLRLTIDSGDTRARVAAEQLRIEAKVHSDRARSHQRAGRWKDAIAELQKAIPLDPTSAVICNNLAWFLATCPDLELRDIPLAVELAARAVELGPNNANSRNTHGVCLYRARDWRRAIDELTKAVELAPDKDLGHNAFFLAMSHWRLGEPDPARTWFTRGVEWAEKNDPTDEELQRFHAEADQLLRQDPMQPK